MAKKINHRGHGGHRELLFFSVSSVLTEDTESTESCYLSLCPLCSLWFSGPIPADNKKSHNRRDDGLPEMIRFLWMFLRSRYPPATFVTPISNISVDTV
jgi:hypothetical protein